MMLSDREANDKFGTSVAVSGDVVVVGALTDDDDSINSGAAYKYRNDDDNGTSSGSASMFLNDVNSGTYEEV